MSDSFRLEVETHGGVADLSRVISALAIFEVTPLRLSARRRGEGLTIECLIDEDGRTRDLCVGRLRAMMSVRCVRLRPTGGAGA
jgi:hypothetical protein